ncbi:CoA-binding protein [Bacillaceae bacterium SIJ1]|nr:CoA-binding protein [Litoribacterium kuwaitense]NGP44018.1 CoA-binding protein [Litoribacterium kuwaitense]
MMNIATEEMNEMLKTAQTIAIVGLSDNPMRTSYQVAQEMQAKGYRIIPVNPTIDESLGVPAVASLLDIESAVDIVNVFRRPEYLFSVAEETVKAGFPFFWAQLGIEDQETYDYLTKHEVKTVMNRCIQVEHARLKRS